MENLLRALLENQRYKNADGTYNKLRQASEEVVMPVETTYDGKDPRDMDELLLLALDHGASDVHITAVAPPKYRINGELMPMKGYNKLTPRAVRMLLEPMLNEDQLRFFDSDGDLDFAYSMEGHQRFRVNFYKQRGSWAGVFRILNKTIPTVESLGIPRSVVELVNKRRGLVLVTGPTGSGKSTTLASLINIINTKQHKNIITLEDPIEYLHRHALSSVSQREIGVDSRSFSSALRAALREDPDVILLGEMRDFETISTAITAAETGHLVFSTLHTIGAAPTIDRIIDSFPVSQQGQIRSQLSSILEGVISQQLIPTIDGSRVAAFEVMLGTVAVKSLIREGKTEQIAGTIQTGTIHGMQLLDDHIVKLVKSGRISSERAVEFSFDRKSMEDRMRRS